MTDDPFEGFNFYYDTTPLLAADHPSRHQPGPIPPVLDEDRPVFGWVLTDRATNALRFVCALVRRHRWTTNLGVRRCQRCGRREHLWIVNR